jgi:very-short-patch-repair endonuclease
MSVITYEKTFASHKKSQFWSNKNGDIKPCNIPLNYPRKMWFNCDKCTHSFEQFIYHIVSTNVWCPYCPNKKLCENIDCLECFEKSFASHEKSKYWSNKNCVLPRNVFNCSGKKYYFNCNKCSHVNFILRIADITSNGNWCSFCSHQKLCENLDCLECFEKSFASHEKSKNWSDKNKTVPRQTFKLCRKKFWFNCDKCTHSFEQYLNHVNKGVWCPYCSNKKMCYVVDCIDCYNKSFASHEKSKYWSDKNKTSPRNVFKVCYKKIIFNCDKCTNEYERYLSNNTGCPYCVNKTEAKLYENLKPLYPTLITQFKQEWCKKLRYLSFDFCISNHKIIIELDGQQHFQQVSNWSSPEEQFENDKYKEKCANDNGYSVIRILQESVFYDTYDWIKELCETIEELKNGDEVANVYLCKNGEYDKY